MKSLSSIRHRRSFKKVNLLTSAGLWNELFTSKKNATQKNVTQKNDINKSNSNLNFFVRQRKLIKIYKNDSMQKIIKRDISKKSRINRYINYQNSPVMNGKTTKSLTIHSNSRDKEIRLKEDYKELIKSFKEMLKNHEYTTNSTMENTDILLQTLNKRWEVMEIPHCHRLYEQRIHFRIYIKHRV